MKITLANIVLILFLGCLKTKEDVSIEKDLSKGVDNNAKEIRVFDAGGPEYPPFILLKVEEAKTVKYIYSESMTLRDSLIIKNNMQNSQLLKEVPQEFLNSSGGHFSSPNDDNGLLFYIKLENNVENRWGVFLNNYQYSKSIKEFTNKINLLIQD